MNRRALEYQADRLERALTVHNAPGRVTGGTVTPRWVRFVVYPEPGVKVDRVRSLSEDLARALAVASVRVSRRGATLAVEVPRDDPQPVRLLPLMRQLEASGGKIPPATAVLGLEENGTPLLVRLPSPDVAHVLTAGTTGSGKTALLRAMIMSLALTHRRSELGLVLIDVRGGPAFDCFGGLPHLVRGVVRDVGEAVETLGSLVKLMEVRDRERVTVPPVCIFIDELADTLMAGGDRAEFALTRLLQRGRGCGLHVVGATQKPTAAVIGSIARANFPVRLVGRVVSPEDAKVAAGRRATGAEQLGGRGDFLAVAEGRVTRFQAAFVSETDIASELEARGWAAPALPAAKDETAAVAGALGLRPWPYKQADDRYMFCSVVSAKAKGHDWGPDGCTSYPECDLTGGGPCALDDPAFDWERAAERARSQPLIVDLPPASEPDPIDELAERLRGMGWDVSQSYRAACRALNCAEGGAEFLQVKEAVDMLRGSAQSGPGGAGGSAMLQEKESGNGQRSSGPGVLSGSNSKSTAWPAALLAYEGGEG